MSHHTSSLFIIGAVVLHIINETNGCYGAFQEPTGLYHHSVQVPDHKSSHHRYIPGGDHFENPYHHHERHGSFYKPRDQPDLSETEIRHRLFPRLLRTDINNSAVEERILRRQLQEKAKVIDYLNVHHVPIGKFIRIQGNDSNAKLSSIDKMTLEEEDKAAEDLLVQLIIESNVTRLFENCGAYFSHQEKEAPWHVSLHCNNAGHICSGALISEQTVLSSFDCLDAP